MESETRNSSSSRILTHKERPINLYTYQILALLVGPILTLVTGLVTKASWAGWAKGIVLLFLSAAGGVLASAMDAANANAAWDWRMAVLTGFGVFVSGVVAHFGLLKGTRLSEAAQNSGNKDNYHLSA